MPQTFDVLLICTANQCRSPMAEFLLRDVVARRGLDWRVGSAGTHARPGRGMDEKASRLLHSRGIDVGDWCSRRVERWMLENSQLILTATREHRTMIVGSRPDLMARTFPLLQFAALAEVAHANALVPRPRHLTGTSSLDGTSLLEAVKSAQGQTQIQPDDVDLADPVGRSYRRFRACAEVIDRAIRQMLPD
ncbi:low molecular weight phosphatase family protein [Microlunatus elymi]|uniref:Low molecular weight phosphatase family protein n=1 Tax=Microlunatus elymi TaxID=2596828 RepID=A0A516PVI5_9ACTN|nr:low molecular weight phosphatase family protein [Microlunatus elymi]QDP95183.1 low molecular weight phosphatase family protein [Microlunatus elymi]